MDLHFGAFFKVPCLVTSTHVRHIFRYSVLIHPCIHLFSSYTPNQDLAFELLNEGLSFDDIAQRLGYSVDMVLALFDDAGSTAHDDGVAVAADVVFDTLTNEQMAADETLLAVEGVRIVATICY